MGLISEMMCKHTIQGKKILKNVVFIAACNPYRKLTKEIKNVGLVNKELHIKRNLVYTVHPLPHSLLNYVFDFGNLTPEDEKSYIKSMISQVIEKYFEDKNCNDCIELKNLSVNSIVQSQNFIRSKNDVSSVSLREVRRFNIFYEFFVEYLLKKKNNKIEKTNFNQNDTELMTPLDIIP